MLQPKNSHELDELKRQLISHVRDFICSKLDCGKNGSDIAAQFIKILGTENNTIKDPSKILKAFTTKLMELDISAANGAYHETEIQTINVLKEAIDYYENVGKSDPFKFGHKPVARPTKDSIEQACEHIQNHITQLILSATTARRS